MHLDKWNVWRSDILYFWQSSAIKYDKFYTFFPLEHQSALHLPISGVNKILMR